MVHLKGVEFYNGHRYKMFVADDQYTYGSFPIDHISTIVKLESPFTIVQYPFSEEVLGVIRDKSYQPNLNLRIGIEVFQKWPTPLVAEKKIYEIWINSIFREYHLSKKQLVLNFQATSIYENYAKQLQALLG